jgi:cation:H+ antiporter
MFLVGGVVLLYFGAGWFVGGASSLAHALRVPQQLVGLTVVAYGTSAPEIVVGIEAAAGGHGAVALGNVIGSNIANIGLILGVAAVIRPARVDGELRRRELPMLLVGTAAVPLVLLDERLSRWEAAALLLVAVIYTGWMVRLARTASIVTRAARDASATTHAADAAGAPGPGGKLRAIVIATFGLLVLLLGGNLFVSAAVAVARDLGMSEQLVGVTIVAVGTSLPELVTSAIAAGRGHSDLAVGNVVGSNIFNVFLCLGASGLAGAVGAPLSTLAVDLAALGVMTAVVALFLRTARTMTRVEGAIVLAMYAAFIAVAVARG